METRVRFAPSNTGWLHVGGARTAIFNWLFAKKTDGMFLLRIEDTDPQRSKDEFTEEILNSLKWLGMDWNEDIVFQSKNIERHQKTAETLLKSGHAYRCFCTPEELQQQREEARKNKTSYNYNRKCLKLSDEEIQKKLDNNEKFALRFHMPDGDTSFNDNGKIRTTSNREIEDFIILRSDGTPTYQIAVVSDDIAMGITHIIRGDDHLTNTFKQINIYEALGKTPPSFTSVPLIYGPDKKKLSKKHGAVGIIEYKKEGILPEPFFNFLALLGWSSGDDREIYRIPELVEAFSLEKINPSPAVFDVKKLEWMNAEYIANVPDEQLLEMIIEYNRDAQFVKDMQGLDRAYQLEAVGLVKSRLKSLTGIELAVGYLFSDPDEYDEKTVKKRWKQTSPEILEKISAILAGLTEFTPAAIETALREFVESENISGGAVIHPLRLALSGTGAGPGLFEMMEVLGKNTCMRRIGKAMKVLPD